jgi:hypothetical protein
MSKLSRAILMMVVYIGWLAGFAWGLSTWRGYHFGFTFLVVIGVYVALLLTYVGYRRAAVRIKGPRLRNASLTEDRLPSHKS